MYIPRGIKSKLVRFGENFEVLGIFHGGLETTHFYRRNFLVSPTQNA
jgi:hypothetical protein